MSNIVLSYKTIIAKINDNDNVLKKAREIINKYIPDCALIVSEVARIVPKYGAFRYTQPHIPRGSAKEGAMYINIFDIVDNADTIKISDIPPANDIQGFKRNILIQASLPEVEILSVNTTSQNVSKGKNFDDYMFWANAAIRFYNNVTNKNISEIDLEKEEKSYFGGLKVNNIDGKRIDQLSGKISAAVKVFTDPIIREKLTGTKKIFKDIVKATINKMNDEKNRYWTIKTYKSIGEDPIYEKIREIFLEHNEIYNNAFDIDTSDYIHVTTKMLINKTFDVNVKTGKISEGKDFKEFKSQPDFPLNLYKPRKR